MDSLLERFLRYVRINTQSDETSTSSPSTARQLELCRLLADECRQLGLADVSLNEQGTVVATIPASPGCEAPAIAWFAHVDTSPEFTAEGVNPIVHENYDGRDIVLPGDPSRVLRVEEHPELVQRVGDTIITTDGTTLLGADDKCGVAVIMTAAERLMRQSDVVHGPIRVCFTCDEEIGRGVEGVDIARLDAICGYTLDGGGEGEIDVETFSADLATVTVAGVNTHPSEGKGVMVNAVRILAALLSRLPADRLSPETTAGREGFLHPYHVEGGVAEASARILLRDFETERLAEYAALLEELAEPLRRQSPQARITIDIKRQYRNLREGLAKEPRAVRFAEEAMRRAGVQPRKTIVRGGTDGSLLTERGLPTPNLSCGQHNPHSPLEWASWQQMHKAVDVLMQLAALWGQESRTP